MNKSTLSRTIQSTSLALVASISAFHVSAMSDELYIGETLYLNDPAITDVVIGNDQIVKAKNIGRKGIALTGVTAGDTTVKIWNGKQYISSEVHVFPSNLKKTLENLRSALGTIPNLSINIVGDNVVLQGANISSDDKDKIDNYASLFKNVVNLAKTKENNVQEKQKMIYLDVRVVEISTSSTKEIGINWNTSSIDGPKFGIMGDLKRSAAFSSANNPLANNILPLPKIDPFQTYFGLASYIDSKINLLQENGTAKIIARPLLSCKNGGNATFLSGGQIPYQSSGATGTPSIEFKDYGIKLDIHPTISNEGIVAKILAEVSTIDSSVQVSGVPGFATRRTETEFVVGQGQTLVLSGLVGAEKNSTGSAVPGLGKIPILGNLFKSRSNQIKQNELVFFVTPYVYEKDFESKMQRIGQSADSVAQAELGSGLMLPRNYNLQDENVDETENNK
ncbi:pilus assembly protein N-terminal domain-containing protein [Acinetobacter sp. AYS6]|uniref:type II and III secretion system protein family protein n=1 Tax=Acinetobacter sp. AYS6 TaxID=2983297 RepID=UPI0021D684A2|nr:pilus assembly protein N-terminal domain-containing protein [Acinetobacter sp. AYS6]MCU7696906.1 pilus assembly protein N-terminal domain-containing protein [Acinetobacter sp. AYS6]